MEEMNRELFDAYKLAEQELEEVNAQLIEACKMAEQKVADIKRRLQEAAIPAKETAVGAIREILLDAPDEIGTKTYKGDNIPSDLRMQAVANFNRTFKAKDIILLTTYEDNNIAFTENALYFWGTYDDFKNISIIYSQFKKCYIDNVHINFITNIDNDNSKDNDTPFPNVILSFMNNRDSADAKFEWGAYGRDKYKNNLYNLIMDLKEAATDIS